MVRLSFKRQRLESLGSLEVKMIYYVKNIDIEGPGTMGEFFARQGLISRTIELGQGDMLPEDIKDDDVVVILGGPMNVDEEDKYPFLKEVKGFIRQTIKRDILTIGLCLGAQLIADAAGARVYKSPVEEIGFRDLRLTEEGVKDPVFKGVDRVMPFFEWHEDTFDLPEGAVLLVEGQECRHQVFRLGSRVYGFQCHMEISRKDALIWTERYTKTTERAELADRINKEFILYEDEFFQLAEKIYKNMFKMITRGY